MFLIPGRYRSLTKNETTNWTQRYDNNQNVRMFLGILGGIAEKKTIIGLENRELNYKLIKIGSSLPPKNHLGRTPHNPTKFWIDYMELVERRDIDALNLIYLVIVESRLVVHSDESRVHITNSWSEFARCYWIIHWNIEPACKLVIPISIWFIKKFLRIKFSEAWGFFVLLAGNWLFLFCLD